MTDSIFTRIINKEIAADVVYEDELCFAIKDINPQAPLHLLLIPKQPLAMLAQAGPQDQALLGHLMLAVGKIARQFNIEDAFRVAINNGAKAGQSVFHLHLHILAGRSFKWPPG
jgi:histidine triad (HIT) family protein